MISGRAVPALERLFFSVSRGKSAGQADQHSTLPQPWLGSCSAWVRVGQVIH
jgi:hypothetical protein